jgi:hypothetical protein
MSKETPGMDCPKCGTNRAYYKHTISASCLFPYTHDTTDHLDWKCGVCGHVDTVSTVAAVTAAREQRIQEAAATIAPVAAKPQIFFCNQCNGAVPAPNNYALGSHTWDTPTGDYPLCQCGETKPQRPQPVATQYPVTHTPPAVIYRTQLNMTARILLCFVVIIVGYVFALGIERLVAEENRALIFLPSLVLVFVLFWRIILKLASSVEAQLEKLPEEVDYPTMRCVLDRAMEPLREFQRLTRQNVHDFGNTQRNLTGQGGQSGRRPMGWKIR